jgi:hypothetical protein
MPNANAEGVYIFIRSIRLRNGKRIFASSYGKQAFRIKVRKKRRR